MKVQFLDRYTSPEMVALGIAELVLTFTLMLVLLTPSSGGFTAASVHPAFILALTVGFIAVVIGLYRPQIFLRARTLVFNTVLSALLSFPAVWIVSKALGLATYWPVGYDPFRPLKIVMIWSGGVVAIRLVFLIATHCNLFLHRVAVVGSSDAIANFMCHRANRTRFLEVTPVRAESASASQLKAGRIRTLIMANGAEHSIPASIGNEYRRHGISVQNQAEFWERYLRRVDVGSLTGTQLDEFQNRKTSNLTRVVTRVLDILTSLGLLVATFPLMGIVALLVRLDSPGSVLYRQERLGLNSKPFTVLKFRSMRMNAEAAGPIWAQQKDPRVTRLGSFIRKTRIDELPQLFNVLRGEMSFIGPRPERPHFVEQLKKAIPHYDQRDKVKPGLTGWAQVNYPYGASVEDARAKLSYDLYYVKNRTLVLDFIILLATVRVILFQEGAR